MIKIKIENMVSRNTKRIYVSFIVHKIRQLLQSFSQYSLLIIHLDF